MTTITTSIFGQTYEGEVLYHTDTETIELVFDLGETNGLIKIVFHNDDTFDYYQYLVFDLTPEEPRNLYALADMTGGEIVYTARTHHMRSGGIVPSTMAG